MDIKLPRLGEGAEAGVVVSILVREGDEIQAGQTILELENEKAVAPIPATVSGRVSSIRVREGERVSVGQVLMSVGDAGAAPVPAAATAAPPARAATAAGSARTAAPSAAPVPVESEAVAVAENAGEFLQAAESVVASPGVRRVAIDLGIDLRRVRGSGPGGRIGMGDVRAYVQEALRGASQERVASAAPDRGPATPARRPASPSIFPSGVLCTRSR